MEKYDPATNTFTLGSIQLPYVFYWGHCAAALSTGQIVIAGSNEAGQESKANLFDPATQTMTPLPDMPGPKRGGSCGVAPSSLAGEDFVITVGER